MEIGTNAESIKLAEIKRQALVNALTKEARTRLNILKTTHPILAAQVEQKILEAMLAGLLKEKITEEGLKTILARISQKQSSQSNIKIVRK
ncbi:MAG: DNA-binding protein [Candidatus Nanoarchaeia archaeon]